jgi:hypothetical protein
MALPPLTAGPVGIDGRREPRIRRERLVVRSKTRTVGTDAFWWVPRSFLENGRARAKSQCGQHWERFDATRADCQSNKSMVGGAFSKVPSISQPRRVISAGSSIFGRSFLG